MGKKTFKAETKQLLDLMINSIYTHKEIFLRELISNASDAIDKVKFNSLTEPEIVGDDNDYHIALSFDKDNHTISISDNGIGMTYDEVVNNIGTIAKSGSKEFFQKLSENEELKDNPEFIGQFGVGFYSSFMVAEKVVLETKSPYDEKGVKWESTGDGTYTIDNTDITERGTTITLYLREEIVESSDYNFLDQYELENLVKKYSDYIRYPIKMDFYTEKPEEKDDDGNVTKEKEIEVENKTMNSMVPIWHKNKEEIGKDEYTQFYRHAFHMWDDPLDVVHSKGEGTIEFTALLFIPGKAPFDFYSSQYERGLKLYSKQVFIMEKCKELLPEYLGFVKGLVDSPDFSLNISREMLQHDRQLKVIAKNIEKKILQSLKYMLENKRDDYKTFWDEFGRSLKAGVYAEFGANKEKLQDLLLFSSSKSEDLITLKEYTERMPETQKEIYYAAGKDRETIEKMPQMEMFREKEIEVLYFIDKIDEFTSVTLREYDGKQLKSIAATDITLDENEEKEKKEEYEKQEQENKDLLTAIKDYLNSKVTEVKLSHRLKNSPCCLVSGKDGISLNMEQVLSEANMGGGMPAPKAEKILELNPDHKIFNAMKKLHEEKASENTLKNYAGLLYNQALLMEGLPIENPAEFADQISTLMVNVGE